MQLLSKTNFFQSLDRSLFPFFLPDPGNSQRKLHIGKHRLMRNQIITLKYKTNGMIPIGIPVSVFIFFRGNPVDDQITTIVTVQSTDDVKKRRLSRTTRSQDRNKFIVPEIQAYIIQCLLYQRTCTVFFADMLDLKHKNFSF